MSDSYIGVIDTVSVDERVSVRFDESTTITQFDRKDVLHVLREGCLMQVYGEDVIREDKVLLITPNSVVKEKCNLF